MEESFYFTSLYFSAGVTFAFGVCFLFISIPQIPTLQSYKKARLAMAVAYISLSVLNALNSIDHIGLPPQDIYTEQSLTAIGAMMQAALFTYTLIVLIHPEAIQKKTIAAEWPAILLPCLLLCPTIFNSPKPPFHSSFFHAFVGYYGFTLVRYTWLFTKNYRHYIHRFNNFFSEEESARLRWIQYSFFGALVIGIGALLLTLSDQVVHYLLFHFLSTGFYIYFGIQLIDYASRFKQIESIVAEEHKPMKEVRNSRLNYGDLEKKLEQWTEEKRFTTPRITIEQLAQALATNRTYLSDYINSNYKQTFNEWINRLRIEEAQKMLLAESGLSISEIGERVGYTDKSHFGRQFTKLVGESPNKWRKLHTIAQT